MERGKIIRLKDLNIKVFGDTLVNVCKRVLTISARINQVTCKDIKGNDNSIEQMQIEEQQFNLISDLMHIRM